MPAVTSRRLAQLAEAERDALAARLLVLVAPAPEAPQEAPVRPVEDPGPRRTPWKALGLAFGAGLATAWLIRRRRK